MYVSKSDSFVVTNTAGVMDHVTPEGYWFESLGKQKSLNFKRDLTSAEVKWLNWSAGKSDELNNTNFTWSAADSLLLC